MQQTVPADSTHLNEPRRDVLIKQKQREDEELLLQELKGEVDGRVHDARAVCPYGVGHVSNVDRVQKLVVASPLYKYLWHKPCSQVKSHLIGHISLSSTNHLVVQIVIVL